MSEQQTGYEHGVAANHMLRQLREAIYRGGQSTGGLLTGLLTELSAPSGT